MTWAEVFREYFDIGLGLDEKEKATYHLIERYWDRVSDRLKVKKTELREKAKIRAAEVMWEMAQAPSFMSKVLKPDDIWQSVEVKL